MLLRIALIAFFAAFSASLAPTPAPTSAETSTGCTATETTPGVGCGCC